MDENERKKKMYERIEEKTGVISNPTEVNIFKFLTASGFPEHLFKEWTDEAKRFYNDIYWVKAWSDHLKAQAYDIIIGNSIDVSKEEAINETEQQIKKEEKEKDKTTEENEEDIPLIGEGYQDKGEDE